MNWDTAPNQTYFTDTVVGRYMIRRDTPRGRIFRLFLNGERTKYTGSVEHLKRTVEQIIFGLAQADGRELR